MKYDVVVVGGSYSGMAAALKLLCARRSVLVSMRGCGATASPATRLVFWVRTASTRPRSRDRRAGGLKRIRR